LHGHAEKENAHPPDKTAYQLSQSGVPRTRCGCFMCMTEWSLRPRRVNIKSMNRVLFV